MKVQITKDFWDGSKSKSKIVNLDGLSISALSFILMESGVAGITITRVENLNYMIKNLTRIKDHENANNRIIKK